MSVICEHCGHEMTNRENVYGTFCVKCNKFISPQKKPKIIQEAEQRLIEQQAVIRDYLRRTILGDKNGN